MKRTYTALAMLFLLSLNARSQDVAERPAADAADVASVDALMAAVYDVISGPAGEARDWDRFRSLFHPEARLIPTGRSADGSFVIRFWTPEAYIATAGETLESRGFFEREIHRVQEAYGPIVHAFSTYESRRNAEDPEPFARGINSFQLVHDGDRWWVVNIFWQGETPANAIPAQYLPD